MSLVGNKILARNYFETNTTFPAGDHVFKVEPFGTIELSQIVY
jgi:hypothetical protein